MIGTHQATTGTLRFIHSDILHGTITDHGTIHIIMIRSTAVLATDATDSATVGVLVMDWDMV